MNTVILACLSFGTGNNSTAIRIRDHLVSNGCNATLKCATATKNATELKEYLCRHDIGAVFGIHAYRAGRLLQDCNVPYVIVFGGTDLNEHYKNGEKLNVMTNAVEKARFCIAFNEPMKQKATSLWVNVKEKIVVQSQGVSVLSLKLSLQEKDLQILHQKHQDLLNNNAIIFLLVGGLRPVKDPAFLADVITEWHKEDARIHLVVVGPELDKEYSSRFKNCCKKSSGIIMVDSLPPSALQRAIQNASALVNTSVSEGMANSLLEAMSLGTPVLARSNEGNAAIIEHRKNGFLFDSPQDFKRLAEELISSDSMRQNIIKSAHSYISKYHSLEEECATYCKIAEFLISETI